MNEENNTKAQEEVLGAPEEQLKNPEKKSPYAGVAQIVPVKSTKQMTEYQSHKRVHGEKILKIIPEAEVPEDAADRPEIGGAQIVFDNMTFINVEPAYLEKHKPEIGGYVVIYKGGYASFSPAKAFEEGNTKVDTEIINEILPVGNIEVFKLETEGPRLVAHISLQVPSKDENALGGYKYIYVTAPVTPRDIQMSANNNPLVDQSVKKEAVNAATE